MLHHVCVSWESQQFGGASPPLSCTDVLDRKNMHLHWVDYYAEFARFRSNGMRVDSRTKIMGALRYRTLFETFHTIPHTEVSGVENIGQCGRLSQLSWLLGAL